MTKKLKGIVAVAVILFVAAVVSKVAMMHAQGSPQTIEITITPNSDPTGPPSVKPDPAEVGPQDQVEWTCSNGCDFTVAFGEPGRKPFNDRVFNNSHRQSGKPIGASGKYKYSVIVGEGVADPIIYVK